MPGVDQPVCDRPLPDQALARRDQILHAIGFAARRFLGSAGLEDAMRAVLEQLGHATGVSRTYVFENFTTPDGNLRTRQRWEWAASGVEPQIDNESMHDLEYRRDGFERWRHAFEQGEAMYGLVETFPPTERAVLEAQGILSLAAVPIVDGSRWWGFIGFDDCTGGRDWEQAEVSALQAAAGVIGAALQRRDNVRLLEQRDAQLRQAQQMEALGRMARSVAHDFNNLLQIIGGEADLLLDDLASDAHEDRRSAAAIRSAAARGLDLTQQLLSFSRQREPRPERFAVADVLRRQETFLQRALGRDMAVGLHLADAATEIHMDRAQFEQILMNLVINARDAMPGGGRLDLGVDAVVAEHPVDGGRRRHVRLVVSDTGQGMDEETRARIFEPFYTTKDDGTGLGLATVFALVQEAGGFVAVDSTPGRGSSFVVYLPPAGEVA